MTNVSTQDDQFIQKVNEVIEANMTNSRFGVSQLAREMHMSRSNLHRKVRKITGRAINRVICETRLNKAMALIKQGSFTVSEIAYEVGFGSVTYFNKCFHDFFGFPPGEAMKRDLSKLPAGSDQNREFSAGYRIKRHSKLIAVLSLIVLASATFVLIVIKPFAGEHKEAEKSIAVLPFINDSPDTANLYFINGIMEGILDNLQKIKDMRVLSRTSAEQYRNNKTKSIPQIARELGVRYIVEGSGQKFEDQVVLSIQLVDAISDKHLFSERYNRRWEDIFILQSEIATLVATSIKAAISPEEAELLEKKPTDNIAAYNLYLRGSELNRIGSLDNNDDLQRQSMLFFQKAIELDSSFSEAYIPLGWNFALLDQDYDTALYYANRALHFDVKNSNAYCLKGWIFLWHPDKDKLMESEDALRLAIKYNPNYSMGYHHLGDLYWRKGDNPRCIEYKLKALMLEKDPFNRWIILQFLCDRLLYLGFYEEASLLAEELTEYSNDSLLYYKIKFNLQFTLGDYNSAYKTAKTAVMSNKWKDFNHLTLAWICKFNGDYPAALKHVEEYIDTQEKQGKKVDPDGMIGYIYLKNGQKEKSDYHFNGYISNQLKEIEKNQPNASWWNYINLNRVYAAMGEKEKALEYLRKAANCNYPADLYTYLSYINNNPPMYETIQDEPEFQEFFQHIDDRLRPDREKIKKSLQEAGIHN